MTSLLQDYSRVRTQTVALIEGLTAEDCQAQSMPDASPAKWHLAHTTWFFEVMVLKHFWPDFQPFHPDYAVLFNSYYRAVGDRHPRPDRGCLTRPTLEEVLRWRSVVDGQMASLLDGRQPPLRPAGLPDLHWMVQLGLHHEQQHQELLLTDLKHLFSRSQLWPAYRPSLGSPSASSAERPAPRWVEGPSGLVQVGQDQNPSSFAFDNESPRHPVHLQPYALCDSLVTQADFWQFMQDGGYDDPRWWLDAGWTWRQRESIDRPAYWAVQGDQPLDHATGFDDLECLQLSGGRQPLDPAAPVSHVSYFEADAYARWASQRLAGHEGVRLPLEAEWEAMVEAAGWEAQVESAVLLESGRLMPTPEIGLGASRPQWLGQVWQWTASPYVGYPGFRPWDHLAGEYNGKFMVNQMVLRGGSCLSPRHHLRQTYRNFFPPESRWQMSGFRLARNV